MIRAKERERAYDDIDYEKEMRDSLREIPMPKQQERLFGRASTEKDGDVLLQIPKLVTPL